MVRAARRRLALPGNAASSVRLASRITHHGSQNHPEEPHPTPHALPSAYGHRPPHPHRLLANPRRDGPLAALRVRRRRRVVGVGQQADGGKTPRRQGPRPRNQSRRRRRAPASVQLRRAAFHRQHVPPGRQPRRHLQLSAVHPANRRRRLLRHLGAHGPGLRPCPPRRRLRSRRARRPRGERDRRRAARRPRPRHRPGGRTFR